VLELAEDNTLLRAIVTATHGANTDLLPLLTTHAGSLLTEVTTTLTARVRTYRPPLGDDQVGVLVDLVVRTVLSHIMQPGNRPSVTADGIAWAARRVLASC
jgi:hypothetical protein